MSQFPTSYDTDISLPPINDNITEIGGTAINQLRDFAFNTEQYIGLGANGSLPSIAARLGISILPDGTINPSIISSAITSLGLITNESIAPLAGIEESKLHLDYPTASLSASINDLSDDVKTAIGWIATTGIQLEPHLLGITGYRHSLDQIDVSHDLVNFPYLQSKFGTTRGLVSASPSGVGYRDNTEAYDLINDINNELLAHQWADGSPFGTIRSVITNDGSSYPSNYAHTASGIFIDPTRFDSIPQTNNNLQLFADYLDQSSLLSLGGRVQNLYANGISVNSKSSSLTADGYGQSIVPMTPVYAYLKGQTGIAGQPIDDINYGDDIIQFVPVASATHSFDEQFSQVKVGDIITVNYGTIEVQFVISEKKYSPGSQYVVRIAGKNIMYSTTAMAGITRSLSNNNKYGVLATASGVTAGDGVPPSIIIGTPGGAQCLGLDFSPDEFNEKHYLLYLAMYPDGNPLDGYTILPAIDVTGNSGTTPGAYTLESIVNATNSAFRSPGFNYRFIAFSYKGEFGIMLADSYNNASFSIVSGIVDATGFYSQSLTQSAYANNVIDLFPSSGISSAPDPLGFGPFNANVASPPFQSSYSSAQVAEVATKVFIPLRRNNYYVNGTELDRLNLDIGQALDANGDGYWTASITEVSPYLGPPGYESVSYLVTQDLSTSRLKLGKTLVVQPVDGYSVGVNYGRFVISNIEFTCNPIQTVITVYDGVHAAGSTPVAVAPVGTQVDLYLSSDSVSFDSESSTDFTTPIPSPSFKRYFEVYIDQNANTFTHERGRFNPSGQISVNGITLYNNLSLASVMDVVTISPKLRGYLSSSVTKINLSVLNFNSSTGVFSGYLSSFDGSSFTNIGPTITGKIGEVIRFYDYTDTDYIDVLFNLPATSSSLSSFSTTQYIDIQLFPSLSLDEDIMLISSCQVNDGTKIVNHIQDRREFGNTSEEQFTTSAIDYIAAPDRLLHFNGVVRGFDVSGITNGSISISGGLALVNGGLIYANDQVITIPGIQEVISGAPYPINFALCINSVGELIAQPITDYDSSLGTPSVGDRVMTVLNAVTLNSYVVDSNLFSYILNNRKDLTVLYIVSSMVTGTGTGVTTSLTSRDVRRFINDSDSTDSAVLTNDSSQGNFRSLSSALNWLKLNSAFQDVLEVKGSFTINTDPGINFPLSVEGIGSTSSLTFSAPMYISSAAPINFSNVMVVFSSELTAKNVNFDSCTVDIGTSNIGNVTFTNSTINISGLITNISAVSFDNCIINVNIAQAFSIGSGLSFNKCTFNYTYNPIGGTPSYSTNDYVNAGSGLMYVNIGDAGAIGYLNNFSVTNCTFNNSISDHFPFISLQLGGTSANGFVYNAIAQNITISDNTFNCQQDINDIRAVIAITSTITTSAGIAYAPFPKLVNLDISNNACNYDQMILVSTVRTQSQAITGSMLTCVNCSISKNTCGVIGYITAADIISSDNNSVNSGTAIRDKSDQLVIIDNSCKLITNLDSVGQYIAFNAYESGTTLTSSTPSDIYWVKVGTGAVSIVRNTCNFILVGTSVYESGNAAGTNASDGILISENKISPIDPGFLAIYTDENSGVTPPNIGILLRSVESSQSDYSLSQSIISGNILNTKFLVSQSDFTSYGSYSIGISCYASAIITNNSISSVCNGASSYMIYLDGKNISAPFAGPTIRCCNNILTRGLYTIGAYISGADPAAINSVAITNNTFDSPTVDGINNTNTGYNISIYWIFHSNINQTAYLVVPLSDQKICVSTNVGTAPTSVAAVPSANANGPVSPQEPLFNDPTIKVIRAVNEYGSSGFGPIGGVGSNYVVIFDAVNGGDLALIKNISFMVQLDAMLPTNAKVISLSVGTYAQTNGSALNVTNTTGNQFTLWAYSHNNSLTSNSINGILDVKSNVNQEYFLDESVRITQQNTLIIGSSPSGPTTDGNGNTYSVITESSLISNTQYITVPIVSPNNFIAGGNYSVAAELDVVYTRVGAASALTLYFSPILVAYRW